MLLAIDVGNSQCHFGVWDGVSWVTRWIGPTQVDQFQVPETLTAVEHVIFASVAPPANAAVESLSKVLTGKPPIQLVYSAALDIVVQYNPPSSLGADRLANVLGALARFKPPILVIDVGTATTFEAINSNGAFVGGAIMAGPKLAATALTNSTALLPNVVLERPKSVLATSTIEAMQSGTVLGNAAAIQGLAEQMVAELGADTTVVMTGGLGPKFAPLCPIVTVQLETLTLDGLVEGYRRLLNG